MDTPPRPHDPLLAPGLVDAGGGGLAARLERWAADARVDEAARARARERWLRRQAEDETALAGVLADLRDGAVPVTVGTRSGGRHAGVVRVVGADFVALGSTTGRGPEVVVALTALASVRTRPGVAAVLGDRPVEAAIRLVDVVTALAEEREALQVVTASGDVVDGVVAGVGQDVLTVRSTGRPVTVAYVPVGAVAEIVLGGWE